MRTTIVRAAGLTTLAAGAAGSAVAFRRRADRLAAETFYDVGEPVLPPPGVSANVTMPAVIHRADVCYSAHAADFAGLAAILEPRGLHPVRLSDGRGLVAFIAGRFHDMTCAGADGRTVVWRPYGEVAIAAFVTRSRALPVLPLVPGVPARLAAGLFWLYIPVTSREARDAGLVGGEPKFVADIEFEDGAVEQRVRVGEGEHEILALSVRPSGPVRMDRRPVHAYAIHHGLLLELATRRLSYERRHIGASGARLTLGDHPVGDALRRLGVDTVPFMSGVYLVSRTVVPPPRVVGKCDDYEGYRGADRAFGRYTIRHPGTDAIDQYADPAERAPRIASLDFTPPWEAAEIAGNRAV